MCHRRPLRRFGFKEAVNTDQIEAGTEPKQSEHNCSPFLASRHTSPCSTSRSGRMAPFSRSDFRYDPTNDVYHCPGGKRLGTSGTVQEGKTFLYRPNNAATPVVPARPSGPVGHHVGVPPVSPSPWVVVVPLNSTSDYPDPVHDPLQPLLQ